METLEVKYNPTLPIWLFLLSCYLLFSFLLTGECPQPSSLVRSQVVDKISMDEIWNIAS